MKFLLKSASSSGRLGVLSNIDRLPDFVLETPHAFLYTTGGTIPHVTHEVLQIITTQNLGLQLPIGSIVNLRDKMKLFKGNIAELIGMHEYLTYCSFVNPGEKRVGDFNEKDRISLWSRYGKKLFSADSYMEFIEDLKPDMFLMLARGDTDSSSTGKRTKKAFSSTIDLFEKCLEIYKKSEILQKSKMIAALEGGFNLDLREKCSEILGESPIFGVAIDGLHDYSEKVSEMNYESIKPVVEASLKHIPTDKLRIIHGCWNPSVVLDLIECGIDMFDLSYPYFVTEQAGALVFPNNDNLLDQFEPNGINGIVIENNDGENEDDNDQKSEMQALEGPVPKKMKLISSSKYQMSLKNPDYASDFSPILNTCTCLACKNHTRAYIYHLINVQELLGSTLLSIHNIHHYLQFFSTIRKALKSGKFQELKKNFQKLSLDKTEIGSLS